MWKYVGKRLLYLIPSILAVSFIVYFLMSFSGDPVLTLLGDTATEQDAELLREQLGLNRPLIVRYFDYMGGVLHGDLGTNLNGSKDVWVEFTSRMPYTIVLACASMIFLLVLSLPLGILAALKHNSWIDTLLSAIAIAGLSIPNFWMGMMMILLFAVKLNWLPVSGAEGWRSIIMPAICAGMSHAALLTRMTRTSMLDNLSADFLRTARAKGVPERTVILKHAMSNALIPIITIAGNQLSILFAGTVAVETVFTWPGVGYLIVNAIRSNEFNMVTGCVLMTTIFVAVILLLIDILYALVDPRIKARYTGK
ncbi:MAG: ABC transporter permease [Lachnospiraceae bacterium]|nr:ABC transporter permease [Lachnospiraceae bacterium]